ncbi:phosphoenolpyruvate-protein phosphotransferase (plasmid) [Halostagnicola larsenii XH-48]|uniref:Phosphoenolpyruvate-protein phosphotransferase n=1 Tax=Halostagnicola larsenii XH-48 TaxID=797299 RepID=W0JSH1_9EURY|nr:phosphoenolpyruvate--protein phosphotransferase [Halostagnicola larsenii]AHG01554.1 phosphoenolpyruvate-protein phosphotransferase [Halostagnicola larsenii XH-48]
MTELGGVGVTPRTGHGIARWHDRTIDLGEPPAPETVDPGDELAAFERARDAARAALERELDRASERVGEAEAEIFDAHIQFLDDPQITDGVESAIEDGLPATHAVRETFDGFVDQFEGMDGRMAERADDLRDVRDRLLRLLVDDESATEPSQADGPDADERIVLLADRLTPSDTANLDPDRVAGIVTKAGGRTSHAAILARSLAIPAIIQVGDALETIADGDHVLVDGEDGRIVVDPDDEALAATAESGPEIREGPVETTDGKHVEVAANLGGTGELTPAVESGADGVGLFRTEFLFLDRETPPTEDEQYDAVTDVLDAFVGDRVVVRTLDIGGDKPVPYLELPEESNPFLGERGIRLSLDRHRDLFETQLRALLRAAASEHGDGLAVMVPLVSTIPELEGALEAVDDVAADLADEGIEHARPELGVMIETPAAVLCADQVAERVEFLSIGTNDLTQYVMAVDRESEALADLHDPLHPPVLRAIRRTVEAGRAEDAWVGMCGEMAGDPDLTELLVGLGLDELSMSAVTVPAVKRRIEETSTDEAEDLAERALEAETRDEVRSLL